MEDAPFDTTIIIGGTGRSYKFSAFPNQINAEQSFILTATLEKEGGVAYDLSSATATLYVSGWKNSVGRTTLTTGGIASNVITFTVPKDLIPEELGGLPLRGGGNSVFFFIVEDADSKLEFFQQVNVYDSNYTLDSSVDPSPNVIVPDKNDLGTVLEVNLNTPPVSPAFEDAYIIGTSPTGDWAGQNNDLTVYNGSSWVFYDTSEGNFVYDLDTSQQYTFNSTIWEPVTGVPVSDSTSIVKGNVDNTKQMRIDVETNVTTGTVRVATMPDSDITLGTDADAIHDNVAGEIDALTEKALPVAGDWLIIEDGADSNNKKKVNVDNLPSGGGSGDMTKAVYDGANVAEQLTGLTATQTLTNKTVNGVVLDATGVATNYLDETGNYSVPAGGGGGTDADAIHDNVANEITAITEKTSISALDEYLQEDSDASFVKKSIKHKTLVQAVPTTETGTTYTLAIDDIDVTMDNASPNVVTIPTNASIAYPVNTVITIAQLGVGATTITGDTGVTVNGVSAGSIVIGSQYGSTVLTKAATDAWVGTVGASETVTTYAKQQNFGTATLTDGANISWDLDTEQVAKVTLAGNRTLDNPTNMIDGGTYIVRVIQDGTGSRTLSYGANYKWVGGVAPVLTTTASAIDIITFTSDGTNMYGVISQGFS
jgi:hypothetical protein